MAGPTTTHARRQRRPQDGEDDVLLDASAPAAPAALAVGAADHPAEAAADAAAVTALSRLARLGTAPAADGAEHQHDHAGHHHGSPTAVRRLAGSGGGAEVGRDGGTMSDRTENSIQARLGTGSPLPEGLKQQMETAFDTPLDRVRVHAGQESADLNSRLSARAFTVGQDIFLGGDQLTSGSARDQHTLAHEIAHTLQGDGAVRREDGDDEVERLSSTDIVAGISESGNYDIGSATKTQAEKAAISWLGPGQYQSRKSGIWWSSDRSRSWRPPSEKKTTNKFVTAGTVQCNFQTHDETGKVLSNGHITIVSAK